MEKRSGGFAAAIIAALSLTNAGAGEHTTGTGIVLKTVNPDGVEIAFDGTSHKIPGGAPFSMAITEVTQGQFERMLGHNPAETDAEHLPVDLVTATEAAAFCKALTERDRAAGVLPEGKIYRLPTLREWLLAALPGGLVPAADAVGATAWHKNNSAGLLHPVGAKTANAYGLHDTIGNAAEWVTPDAALNDLIFGKLPEVFSTKTTIQVVGSPVQRGENPATTFLATQREIIRAQRTLSVVVDKLDLDKRWKATPAEAIEKLKSNLTVSPIRGTELIEIHYRDKEPQLTAQIADAIAESYKTRRVDAARKVAEEAIAELDKTIAEQRAKLDASRAKMLALMERHNIVDLSLGEPAWLRTARKPTIDKTTKAALDRLEGRDLIEAAIDLGLPNEVLKKRHPELLKVRSARAELLMSGLTEQHPKVVAADQQIATLEKILLDTIKATLGSSKGAKAKPVPRKKPEQEGLAERRNNIVYIESKKDYELNKELLENMLAHHAKNRIDARSPFGRVVVHEHAVVPRTPSRPHAAAHPIAIGGTVYDQPDDLADPRSTKPNVRTAGVGFRFVLADEG